MKILKILLISIIFFYSMMTFCMATTLTYTDSTLSPGNNITYILDFNLTDGSTNTYYATFTITNSSNTSPEWYAGWFLFKFDGPQPGTITNIFGPTNTGPWIFVSTTNNADVLTGGGNYNKLAQDGFYGFYQKNIEEGQNIDITKGILLTGIPTTWTFTFYFTVNGNINLNAMPFQVGYYDGLTGSGYPIFNQLSQNLTVPEPGLLVLLGLGLTAVGIGSRWMRRK